MNNALELLILHHENMRILHPDDELMILCECDGAVYDMRVLALHALQSFDRAHGTAFFNNLSAERIAQPPDIDDLLFTLEIPLGISAEIAAWYKQHLWNMDGVWCAHGPLANVLKVFTCLHMQDRTRIGLCAQSSGRTTEEFISIVNALGRPVGIGFNNETIYLDDSDTYIKKPERTLQAWHHFDSKGYRLIAVIDARPHSEPALLFSADRTMEVLFLQERAVREMARMAEAAHELDRNECMLRNRIIGAQRKHRPTDIGYPRHDGAALFQEALP